MLFGFKRYYYGMSEIGLIYEGTLYKREYISKLYNEGKSVLEISEKLRIPVHIVRHYIDYSRTTQFKKSYA